MTDGNAHFPAQPALTALPSVICVLSHLHINICPVQCQAVYLKFIGQKADDSAEFNILSIEAFKAKENPLHKTVSFRTFYEITQ